jgi:flagellar FliJ protein
MRKYIRGVKTVPFQFRLQKLLDYREDKKKLAQEELARRQRELLKIQDEIEKLQKEEQRVLAFHHEHQSEKLDVLTLTALESYRFFLQERLRSKQQELLQSREQVEEQRKVVVESWKNCRVLEKLKEKSLNAFLQEEKSREQRFIDEISLYGYIRDPYRKGGEDI